MAEQTNTPQTETNASNKLNRKYPYLTAFVGFIALYILAGMLAGLIFSLPLVIFPETINVNVYTPKAKIFETVLQIVIGYYVFKYVVKKNILPYIVRWIRVFRVENGLV